MRPRVIPVLLLKDQGLVKSRKFKDHRYIGDPINAARIFNDFKADELILLDIEATAQKRTISTRLTKEFGEELSMPFAVGGGINTLESIQQHITAGAEKVVIGTAAVENPGFIKQAAKRFGSSTLSVCLDIKSALFRGKRVSYRCASRVSGHKPADFARFMEDLGAGELIIQSVALDGLMTGYDLDLLEEVSLAVGIPVVALGGAGQISDLTEAHRRAHVSGVAAGSLFVYHGPRRGVLLNYPDRTRLGATFSEAYEKREGSAPEVSNAR